MILLVKRFVLLGLLIAYMTVIWLQSSHFNPEEMGSILSERISLQFILLIGICLELAHLFQFGIVYILFIMVFLSFGRLSKWMEIAAFAIAFLYGLIDEIHQMYVPFRSASLSDLLKNLIGIMGAWWIIRRCYFSLRDTFVGRILRSVSPPVKGG